MRCMNHDISYIYNLNSLIQSRTLKLSIYFHPQQWGQYAFTKKKGHNTGIIPGKVPVRPILPKKGSFKPNQDEV